MIRYTLKCDQNHGFESWFQGADAFESLLARGLVSCPECGSANVEKALMAPRVRPAGKAADNREQNLSTPENDREAALAKLKREIEASSEYVGMGFASEARKIHEGDAPERPIYGEARPEEAKKLIEDGVPVAPLPFLPGRKAN